MAGTQVIRAGRAFVEVFLKDNRLVRGLQAAQARLRAWGTGIAAIGGVISGTAAAVLGPLLAAANSFSDFGDQIAKAGRRTGISAEALSELAFAAGRSGTSIETVEKGVRGMQKRLVDMANGGTSGRDALDSLGLSVEELMALSPEDQFLTIAQRLKGITDPTLQAATAMELFGRSGAELLPLIQDDIAALRAEARRLGLTLTNEDAAAAEVLNDALGDLKSQTKAIWLQIGAALAPALSDISVRIANVVATVIDWVRSNRPLVVTIAKFAAVAFAAGAAISAVGLGIITTGAVLGGMATIISAIGTALGALLSPIALVIAALVAFTTWFVTATETGGAALDWLAAKFTMLKDFALQTFGGIADALAAGDIALAAKILWLSLQLAWQKGIGVLNGYWIEWKTFFLRVFNEAVFSLAGFFTDAWAGIQVAWVESVAFMADAWTIFTNTLTKGWRSAQNFISKGVLRLMALFDDSVDVEAASKILDEDMARANKSLEQEVTQTITSREAQRKADRAQIESDRQGALGALEQQRSAEDAELSREQQAVLEASENALSEARREWQAAIDEAARKRGELPAGTESGTSPIDKFQESLGEIGGSVADAQERNIEVQGTFNSLAAIRGLGASSTSDRTAKATEETAKNTKRLLQEAQHGGLLFS